MRVIERIQQAEEYLDRMADVIEDTLGEDDSVDWPHDLRTVAVELRAVVLALGQRQTGAVDRERAYREALERVSKTKSIDLAQGVALSALGLNHPGSIEDLPEMSAEEFLGPER